MTESTEQAWQRVHNSTYTLTANGRQMKYIQDACELYERLHAGQWFALENILPLKEGHYWHEVKALLKTHIEPLIDKEKLHFERNTGDIMNVIRHHLAWDFNPDGGFTVDYQKPFKMGNYPLPQIQGGWISVMERLPTNWGWYLVYNADEHTIEKVTLPSSDLKLKNITHWQPYPKPPAE